MAHSETSISRFSRFVISNPWKMILLSILVLMAVGYGGQNLRFDNNYRVFFADENPDLAAFEKLEAVYSKTDNILFTIMPKEGDVFQPHVLKMVQELTAESWKLPFSQRVDSITNYQHTFASENDLTVVDLVEKDPSFYSAKELALRRQIALTESTLVGKVISRDARATGVNVIVNMPRKEMTEVPETVTAARALVEKYREKYPTIELRPSGLVFMNNSFMESSMKDMMTLIPLMYLVFIVMMVVILRSWASTFGTVLVIMFSAIAAMGFGGWMHFPLTPPSASTPTIVLTLAIADSIHIIVSMLAAMRAGMTKHDAIVESLRINFQPIFLTSITTIIGFLSLNFSEAPPFWHLGNMTAFGIGAAFFFSVTLLPAILSLLPVHVKQRAENNQGVMDRISGFIIGRHKPLLWFSVLVVVFLGAMMTRIETNDQFVQYFDTSIPFRLDTEFMQKNLSGINAIEFAIPSKGPAGISDPEYLKKLDAFTQWLRTQPYVDHVYSMSDIFKRLNMNMHGDDKSWYRIPDEKEMAAQYLLLYEFSLPYGLDINDRINIDKSATRVTVTLNDVSTRDIRAFKNRSETWLKENTPEYMHTLASGPVVMFSYISERNIEGMLTGNLISLLLISLIIMIAMRSVFIGTISLIPNLTPVAIGYGLWGLFIQEVNMAVAVSAAVSLGIIVDDSVHFLSKYLRGRREKGLSGKEAVHYAFHTVGWALISTTIILVFGFSVLTQSGFQINSHLGLLTVLVIGSALFADFFLLAPLMIVLDRKSTKNATKGASMKTSSILVLVMCTMLAWPSVSQADSPKVIERTKEALLAFKSAEEIGEEVAIEFDNRDLYFVDQTAKLSMVLKNAYGEESRRQMRNRILEQPQREVGDKSLIIFDSPRDVKGTALLSYAQILKPDNQWLYLPSLKRVKRISSNNKSGPFMGSEFAYEDITGNEIGKYSWRYLTLEPCPNEPSLECFKLDTRPKYEYSGYTKRFVWVDAEEFRPQQIDYYDRKDTLLKTQVFHGYRQYLNHYWRADRWSMVNHQTGKKTDLEFSEYQFKTGLTDANFTQAVLKRIK